MKIIKQPKPGKIELHTITCGKNESISFQDVTFIAVLQLKAENPSQIIFIDCVFTERLLLDKINTQRVLFKNCTFKNELTINHAVLGKMDMLDCHHHKSVTLKNSKICDFLICNNLYSINADISFIKTEIDYMLEC